MVETHWDTLTEKEIPYHDGTWNLTGDVNIRQSGELIALEVTQKDDVRRKHAWLYFQLDSPTDSLNPGNIGNHFDRLERDGSDQYLVVKKERKSYRYRLVRLEYE